MSSLLERLQTRISKIKCSQDDFRLPRFLFSELRIEGILKSKMRYHIAGELGSLISEYKRTSMWTDKAMKIAADATEDVPRQYYLECMSLFLKREGKILRYMEEIAGNLKPEGEKINSFLNHTQDARDIFYHMSEFGNKFMNVLALEDKLKRAVEEQRYEDASRIKRALNLVAPVAEDYLNSIEVFAGNNMKN